MTWFRKCAHDDAHMRAVEAGDMAAAKGPLAETSMTVYHGQTKGEFSGGRPSVDIGSDADIMGKGFYVAADKDYVARSYGRPIELQVSGKWATTQQWVGALARFKEKRIEEQRRLARESLRELGYDGVMQDDPRGKIGVIWSQHVLDRAWDSRGTQAQERTAASSSRSWTCPDCRSEWSDKERVHDSCPYCHGGPPLPSKKVKTPRSTEDLFEAAKRAFGVTEDPGLAGWILPDGSMLSFSQAGRGRDVDHREVGRLLQGVSGWEALRAFMDKGAIRIGQGMANFSRRPTPEQKDALWRYFDHQSKYGMVITLHLYPPAGRLYEEFRPGTPPDTVMDILDEALEGLRVTTASSMSGQDAQQAAIGAAMAKGYNTGPVWHGGTFSVASGDTVFSDWTHFGTKASAEERVGGSGVVDNLIRDIETEQDPETGEWYYTIRGLDSDGTYGSEEEAREEAEKEAVEMAEYDDPGEPSFTGVLLRGRYLRLPDLGTWGLYDVIRNLPQEVRLSAAEKEEVGRLVREGKAGEDWQALTAVLESKGWSGIVYRNKIEDRGSDSYIVFRSSSAKLADPVTRDDSGQVIPLSRRFDPTNPDIRF